MNEVTDKRILRISDRHLDDLHASAKIVMDQGKAGYSRTLIRLWHILRERKTKSRDQ